jgi:hypothetical protein
VSGAITLYVLVRRQGMQSRYGSRDNCWRYGRHWHFVYAAGFRSAYVSMTVLPARCCCLRGADQHDYWDFWQGERLRKGQIAGVALALAGLLALTLPGLLHQTLALPRCWLRA